MDPIANANLMLYGHIIRQAVLDYINKEAKANYKKKTHDGVYWETAKAFLFDEDKLERQLVNLGLSDCINIQYIRNLISSDEIYNIIQKNKSVPMMEGFRCRNG